MATGLVNHLWQSTLVAGLAWLLTLTLRRDRARVRYGVWLAASLKFLVPFSMFTGVGERFGWRPAVLASFTPHEVFVDAAGTGFSERAIRIAAHQSAGAAATGSIWHVVPDVVFAVWAIGAAVLLATWIIRWRRVAAIARRSTPLTAGRVVDAVRKYERQVDRIRQVVVVSSTSALEPGVFGIRTPTLVWPSQLDAHLSAEQVEAIVAHEIMHVRRRDNLAALVHLLAQAAFWFHPLVWWIGARLIDERERACDEAVLGGGSARHAYAESILKTCQLFVESPIACVSGVTGSDLKKRIEHIMTGDLRPGLTLWKKCLLAAVASAAMTVPFVVGVMTVRPLLAQQPSTNAAFDVTSVKANTSGAGMVRMLPAANGGWQAENVSAGMLVRLAYQLQDNQLVGGPKWLFEDRFDVVGTGTAADRDGPMSDKLKSLLADRFKLVVHMETREQPIYALVLARRDGKLGEKITPSTVDCTPPANGRDPARFAPPAPGVRPRCGFMIGPGRINVGGQTMASFAQTLSRFAGGIVVDKTGLTGAYDVELTYAPDPGISLTGRDLPPQPGAAPPVANSDAPSIFTAVQEQLGLRLDSTKGPVDVLVIDSAEKPTPN